METTSVQNVKSISQHEQPYNIWMSAASDCLSIFPSDCPIKPTKNDQTNIHNIPGPSDPRGVLAGHTTGLGFQTGHPDRRVLLSEHILRFTRPVPQRSRSTRCCLCSKPHDPLASEKQEFAVKTNPKM